MDNEFFEKPILNSPYDYLARHWAFDESGQPTQSVQTRRRTAEFFTPYRNHASVKAKRNGAN